MTQLEYDEDQKRRDLTIKKIRVKFVTFWGVVISSLLLVGVVIIPLLYAGVDAFYSQYNVWSKSKIGEAQLAKANWNRQIAVKEAEAARDAAKALAQAEVERAKGVAKANQIIGDSLNNNEAYLRYLWIQNLAVKHNQVIYVPTESNLPILEAGRLKGKK